MSGAKGKSGGKREGAGRPTTDSPKAPVEYRRPPVVIPRSEDQIAAMAWWESLTPRERLWHIKETWIDCGWPKPHKKK